MAYGLEEIDPIATEGVENINLRRALQSFYELGMRDMLLLVVEDLEKLEGKIASNLRLKYQKIHLQMNQRHTDRVRKMVE